MDHPLRLHKDDKRQTERNDIGDPPAKLVALAFSYAKPQSPQGIDKKQKTDYYVLPMLQCVHVLWPH